MLYRKTNFLVGMILTVAMLLVTGTASAQAEEVEVCGFQITRAILDPGINWIDDEGILHVRGLEILVEFFGNIEGFVTQTLDYNVDIDPTSSTFGEGDLHGSAVFEGKLNGVAGELSGHFAGDLTGPGPPPEFFPVFSVDSVGHGDFGGNTAHSHVTTTGLLGSGFATYTGTVLFPHGL